MKTQKQIISFLLSFVLMVMFCITALIIFTKATLFNEKFYYKIINENDTMDKMYEEIELNCRGIFIKNNIIINDFNKVIPKDDVSEEVKETVQSISEYICGNTDEIKAFNDEKFIGNINSFNLQYLKDNNIEYTPSIEENMKNIQESLSKNIEGTIQIANYNSLSKNSKIKAIRDKINILNNPILLIGVIAVDILLMALILFTRKRAYKSLSWIGKSFIVSGLIYFLTCYSAMISGFYKKIPILPDYIEGNLVSMITGCLEYLSIIGIISIIMGLLCSIPKWKHEYKKYITKS